MHSSVISPIRKRAAALIFALVFSVVVAACHNNNLDSGFGIGFTTVTAQPGGGPFAAYMVTIDSVVLTGLVNGPVTVVDIPEIVDFTKLTNISELWDSASIPTDTYTQATITIDYTSANIAVLVNGAPQQATVVDSSGAAVTQISVTVNLDPVNYAYVLPTFATTAAIRLAINFDLGASNLVDFSTNPATVTVAPYFTIATSASDQKLIAIRGPLVNTSLTEQTYSIFVRPFFDEVNTAGSVTMFNSGSPTSGCVANPANPNAPQGSVPQGTCCPPTTPLYTISGTAYTGAAGITQLSQLSAGSTMTEAFTTFVPQVTPSATAGFFCTVYMLGGSTLEDFFTDGVEGDVIARNGNTLTVRGPTLDETANEIVEFFPADAQITLGTGTIVTQDATANVGLNYKSVSVGQHIIARGIASLSAANVVTLDSTGTSSTDTGSVRLISTEMFGSLVSNNSGSLEMNLQGINQYPTSAYNFAGTGTSAATDAVLASYMVDTGSLAVPTDLTVGGPVWVDGVVGPFGSAPPDFIATVVEDEVSHPATLIVTYVNSATNNATAFATLNDDGFSINLGNSLLASAQIHVGAEVIDLSSLPATPQIMPQIVPAPPAPITVPSLTLTPAQLPPTFLPLFSLGSSANGISCYNLFNKFVFFLNQQFAAAPPASVAAITAHGTYNRATNTFTAATINVVL